MSTSESHSPLKSKSETVRASGLVPKDHQYETTYRESNSHVTNDVTEDQVVILIRLEENISKTAVDAI